MLHFRVSMAFAPRAADEALHTLRALTGPVRAEPGCAATRLSRDLDDGGLVTWVAEWRTREEFRRHLESRAFRSVVALMELAAAVPVVEIDEVTSRRGFDLVEELLAAGAAVPHVAPAATRASDPTRRPTSLSRKRTCRGSGRCCRR